MSVSDFWNHWKIDFFLYNNVSLEGADYDLIGNAAFMGVIVRGGSIV